MKPNSLLLVLFCAFLFSACLDTIKRQPEPEQPDKVLETRKEKTSEAQQLLKQANQETDPGKKLQLQLQAAQAFIDSKLHAQAKTLLSEINASGINPVDSAKLNLMKAQILLFERNPQQAQTLIPTLPQDAPAELRVKSHRLRALAHKQLGKRMQSVQELSAIDDISKDQEVLTRSHNLIWQTLSQIPQPELQAALKNTSDTRIKGWLELSLIHREHSLTPTTFQSKMTDWKTRYAQHPAHVSVLGILDQEQKNIQARPSRIALLLPVGGKLREAKAIRDGFIAAHYVTKNSNLHIRIYDTASNDAAALYNKAVSDGAQIVVGPLIKSNVRKVANLEQRSVPVLALNTLQTVQAKSGSTETQSTTTPHNMYFFGLSPEDEARQVAERAIFDNKMLAVVFTPMTKWGMRVQHAFNARYKELGGRVVEYKNYPRNVHDYSKQIIQLLNLDDSKQRFYSLRRTLRAKIEFEPSRRSDVEVVFVAGFARDLRLIAPQLKFHQARDLPIYTTSHVYTGVTSLRRDRDLNGIYFCDSPWNLTARENMSPVKRLIVENWRSRLGRYSRLFALGADSYAVIPYLSWLKSNPSQRYSGQTGILRVDRQNNVRRILTWAKFENAKAAVLQEK